MLEPKIEQALNQQINNELAAWYNYLAMSAYCNELHLGGFASFMDSQSREEQAHAHRLFQYVLDRGANVELRPISPPKQSFRSIRDMFKSAVDQEIANTKAIYEVYELAKSVNDYATIAALQWFLDEQVEEEKVMKDALGLVEFAGEDKSALLTLNTQFGNTRPAAKED
jgi:ferritin